MKTPAWVAFVAAIGCLPIFSMPWLIAKAPDQSDVKLFLWLYPAISLIDAYSSWKSYPERPHLLWLMLVVNLLIAAAMWVLVSL